MAVISSLFVYPIKSCAGISLQTMTFDERGPVGDRRYMLVDASGKFITQREEPSLAKLLPRFEGDELWVARQDGSELRVPAESSRTREVSVWTFTGQSDDMGDEASRWFSESVGRQCYLVRFRDDVFRKTSTLSGRRESQVAFADGYPALVTSLESLVQLNHRLETPVTMNRFRPNVVVRDVHPFAEDDWAALAAPDLTLEVVKPCERCVVTTVDQTTAEQSKEPLSTLASFRKFDGKVLFGQNCVHTSQGELRVGDALAVTTRGAAP